MTLSELVSMVFSRFEHLLPTQYRKSIEARAAYLSQQITWEDYHEVEFAALVSNTHQETVGPRRYLMNAALANGSPFAAWRWCCEFLVSSITNEEWEWNDNTLFRIASTLTMADLPVFYDALEEAGFAHVDLLRQVALVREYPAAGTQNTLAMAIRGIW